MPPAQSPVMVARYSWRSSEHERRKPCRPEHRYRTVTRNVPTHAERPASGADPRRHDTVEQPRAGASRPSATTLSRIVRGGPEPEIVARARRVRLASAVPASSKTTRRACAKVGEPGTRRANRRPAARRPPWACRRRPRVPRRASVCGGRRTDGDLSSRRGLEGSVVRPACERDTSTVIGVTWSGASPSYGEIVSVSAVAGSSVTADPEPARRVGDRSPRAAPRPHASRQQHCAAGGEVGERRASCRACTLPSRSCARPRSTTIRCAGRADRRRSTQRCRDTRTARSAARRRAARGRRRCGCRRRRASRSASVLRADDGVSVSCVTVPLCAVTVTTSGWTSGRHARRRPLAPAFSATAVDREGNRARAAAPSVATASSDRAGLESRVARVERELRRAAAVAVQREVGQRLRQVGRRRRPPGLVAPRTTTDRRRVEAEQMERPAELVGAARRIGARRTPPRRRCRRSAHFQRTVSTSSWALHVASRSALRAASARRASRGRPRRAAPAPRAPSASGATIAAACPRAVGEIGSGCGKEAQHG